MEVRDKKFVCGGALTRGVQFISALMPLTVLLKAICEFVPAHSNDPMHDLRGAPRKRPTP
jgi:hypothetical protein